ncbi:MAG: DUF2283 domain-containing protein [Cyanobacteria bacterium]|jgi:uncharacterized protein YuzE|nr:DUF2283 domain-containing protein [Cyanobacteria bacterium GSL.Bin1]
MKIRHDPVEQTAYIELLSSDIIESEEVTSGIIYDFDQENRIVGIELYHIDKLSLEELKSIYKNLTTETDKKQLSEFLSSLLSVKNV